jgi:hypothetical protein
LTDKTLAPSNFGINPQWAVKLDAVASRQNLIGRAADAPNTHL